MARVIQLSDDTLIEIVQPSQETNNLSIKSSDDPVIVSYLRRLHPNWKLKEVVSSVMSIESRSGGNNTAVVIVEVMSVDFDTAKTEGQYRCKVQVTLNNVGNGLKDYYVSSADKM